MVYLGMEVWRTVLSHNFVATRAALTTSWLLNAIQDTGYHLYGSGPGYIRDHLCQINYVNWRGKWKHILKDHSFWEARQEEAWEGLHGCSPPLEQPAKGLSTTFQRIDFWLFQNAFEEKSTPNMVILLLLFYDFKCILHYSILYGDFNLYIC